MANRQIIQHKTAVLALVVEMIGAVVVGWKKMALENRYGGDKRI